MKPLYRNIFLGIGVVAIVIMLICFPMSWDELWVQVKRAGYWLPFVLALWLPIYMVNAKAWQVIINDGDVDRVGFWRVLKYTISGYALNYVTPVGLLGGEPYRIMELTPYVGSSKAASSVILYAMMHIFSHFCFWSFSIVLFLVLYWSQMNVGLWIMLGFAVVFCGIGIYFFLQGYRKGLAMRMLRFFGHWPLLGKRVKVFAEHHAETLERVDSQIAALHAQRPSTFYLSLFLEFFARMLGCLEIMFALKVLTPDVSYWNCVLMQAFTSLFSNLMFFIPMQMGTREGGYAMVTSRLHMSGTFGVLTGLITRLRELFWTAIGLMLIRVGNKKQEVKE